MNKLLILLCAVLLGVYSTEVKDCKSGPRPLQVLVNDCDIPPCNFKLGGDAILNVTFEATQDLYILKPRVYVTPDFPPVPIDYPIKPADACESLIRGRCPLEEGQRAIYQMRMHMDKNFPPVGASLEFSLYTEDAEKNKITITCFGISVKLVK